MNTKNRTPQQIVQEQVNKWQLACRLSSGGEAKKFEPVITISRLPGCNTVDLVHKLAEKLGFDVFDKNLLDMVAENAQLSSAVMHSLDEREVSVTEELVRSLVDTQFYSADKFFHQLMLLIAAIARHGRSVIVGRGAGLMLPPTQNLRVCLIAPLDLRVANVVAKYGVSQQEARKRVIQRESDRKAYIHKYFNADMTDPLRYDITINLAAQTIDGAVETIIAAWKAKQALHAPAQGK